MNMIIVAPDKEQVRDWMRQRRVNPGPLPDPAQIRSQLGWGMVSALGDSAAAKAAAQQNMSKGMI